MNTKVKVAIVAVLSVIVTLTWILGLIYVNINLFMLSMIILIIFTVFSIKNLEKLKEYFRTIKEKIVEDERKKDIEEKTSLISFGILITLDIYVGITILAFKNYIPSIQVFPMFFSYNYSRIHYLYN